MLAKDCRDACRRHGGVGIALEVRQRHQTAHDRYPVDKDREADQQEVEHRVRGGCYGNRLDDRGGEQACDKGEDHRDERDHTGDQAPGKELADIVVQLVEDTFFILFLRVVLDGFCLFMRRFLILVLIRGEEADDRGEDLFLCGAGILLRFLLLRFGRWLGADDVREHRGVLGVGILLIFRCQHLGESASLDVERISRLFGTVNRHLGDDRVRFFVGNVFRRRFLLHGFLLRGLRFLLRGRLFGLLLLLGGGRILGDRNVDPLDIFYGGSLPVGVGRAEDLAGKLRFLRVFRGERHIDIILRLRRFLLRGRFLRFGLRLSGSRLSGGFGRGDLFLTAVHDQLRLDCGGGFFPDNCVALLGLVVVKLERIGVSEARLFVRVAVNIGNLWFHAVFLRGALHFFAVSHLVRFREDALDFKLLEQLFLLVRVLGNI